MITRDIVCIASLVFLAVLPAPGQAQGVPDDVYGRGGEISNLCGIAGASVAEIRERVENLDGVEQGEGGSDRFDEFLKSAGTSLRQWSFTRETERAHPAVSCRYVYEEDGEVMMTRRMRCDASRRDCDQLFLEFQALDRELQKSVTP